MVQTLVLPPNREIDFDCACVCVACVRASERSCVREMILQWLGAGARICGSVVVHPSSSIRPGGHLGKKVRAARPLTDDSHSFGGGECFPILVSSFRWCFVRVSWVSCWIVVLDPPASTVAVLVFRACFA